MRCSRVTIAESSVRYAAPVDAPPTPPPSAVPAPSVVRRPSSPPGAKRARHKRWVRVATIATGLALVGGVLWMVLGFRPPPTQQESEILGCRDFLSGIAEQVTLFVERRNRLPKTLAELRDTDSPSQYDAEPWDCWKKPIEYRVVDADARDFRLRSYGPDVKPDTPDDLVWPAGKVWR